MSFPGGSPPIEATLAVQTWYPPARETGSSMLTPFAVKGLR